MGNPIRIFRKDMPSVLRMTIAKSGDVKKYRNHLYQGSAQGLPRMPLRMENSLNASTTPYIG